MRLTCPNCGAVYETPAGLIPAAGSHVQCSACDTRWYARETGADRPTEDEIVTRLESRASRPPFQPAPPLPPLPAGRRGVVAPFPGAPAPDLPAPPPEAAPASAAAPEPVLTPAATPLRPSPAAEAADPSEPVAATPRAPATAPVAPRRGRFALGFLLALALSAAALGLYLRPGEATAALPEAGPAIEGYVAWVDGLRETIETRLGPLRDRLVESGT